MFKEILEHFPDPSSYEIYLEAFGGSASILLARELGHTEIYNDIYDNVYSLFKCLSDKNLFVQFKEKCDISIYSEKLRQEFKTELKRKDISVLDRAYYFWYVNRTSHNGVGGFTSNSYIRRKMAKATSDFLSSIDRLPELHGRLSSVIIHSRDAIELIERYNDSKVFMYLDPPYHLDTRGTSRYECDFTNEQHEKFIDVIMNSKAQILVSGYACKAYERLETKFKRVDFNVSMITGDFKKKMATETLWKNY